MKKHSLLVIVAVLLALAAGSAYAAPHGPGDNGLGYTVGGIFESAPDADGDGIPNGQDLDYQPPLDGSGSQFGPRVSAFDSPGLETPIRSNYWFRYMWMGGLGPFMNGLLGNSYGPGDGTGFNGDGPGDGTGYGPGDAMGECDGTLVRERFQRP